MLHKEYSLKYSLPLLICPVTVFVCVNVGRHVYVFVCVGENVCFAFHTCLWGWWSKFPCIMVRTFFSSLVRVSLNLPPLYSFERCVLSFDLWRPDLTLYKPTSLYTVMSLMSCDLPLLPVKMTNTLHTVLHNIINAYEY